MSELKNMYKKELRRLKQFIRRAEKRGYTFPEDVIPKEPKRIRKESVERLQKITPEKLYKKAKYTVPETGKTVSGTTGRKMERHASAVKGVETKRAMGKLPVKRGKVPKKRGPKKGTGKGEKKPRKKQETVGDGVVKEPKDEIPDESYEVIHNIIDELNSFVPPSRFSDQFKRQRKFIAMTAAEIFENAVATIGEKEIAKRIQQAAWDHEEFMTKLRESDSAGWLQTQLVRLYQILFGAAITERESKDLSNIMEYYEKYGEEIERGVMPWDTDLADVQTYIGHRMFERIQGMADWVPDINELGDDWAAQAF